jgi:hypothetical protein
MSEKKRLSIQWVPDDKPQDATFDLDVPEFISIIFKEAASALASAIASALTSKKGDAAAKDPNEDLQDVIFFAADQAKVAMLADSDAGARAAFLAKYPDGPEDTAGYNAARRNRLSCIFTAVFNGTTRALMEYGKEKDRPLPPPNAEALGKVLANAVNGPSLGQTEGKPIMWTQQGRQMAALAVAVADRIACKKALKPAPKPSAPKPTIARDGQDEEDKKTLAASDIEGDISPNSFRARGWSVARHNDYRLEGIPRTFWLFTKGNFCVRGEGRTDNEALAKAWVELERVDG